MITGVGRPPLVGGNAGNDTDSSYFCSRPALGQFTGGNPALPLNSQNSIFNLPFPQLFGWRPHHAQLAAGLNDHKARGRPQHSRRGAGGVERACLYPVSRCNWGSVSYDRLSATGPGQPEAPAHPRQLAGNQRKPSGASQALRRENHSRNAKTEITQQDFIRPNLALAVNSHAPGLTFDIKILTEICKQYPISRREKLQTMAVLNLLVNF